MARGQPGSERVLARYRIRLRKTVRALRSRIHLRSGLIPTGARFSVCPGRHIGEDFLFTAMARTIALFNIAPGDESRGGVPVSELGKTCVAQLLHRSPAGRLGGN